MNGRGTYSHNDIATILYLYKVGRASVNQLIRDLLKHPQRAYRVINRLLKKGIIQDEYEEEYVPEIKMKTKVRYLYLTEKGRQIAEEVMLEWEQRFLSKAVK